MQISLLGSILDVSAAESCSRQYQVCTEYRFEAMGIHLEGGAGAVLNVFGFTTISSLTQPQLNTKSCIELLMQSGDAV